MGENLRQIVIPVLEPHLIHFDVRKVTFDTYSLEHRDIVAQMKGLIERSIILYTDKS